MWSVFEAILTSKEEEQKQQDWQQERKVKVMKTDGWKGEELGDSCCFGTRTIEFGMDCVWKLHGGV